MPTVSVFSGSSVSYSTGDAHVQEINIHGVSYSTGDEDSSFRLGGRSLPRVEILEIELDSPSYSRRSSTPDFLRRRLPSPTRFVYGNRSPSSSPTRGRSPSPLTHGFRAAIGNALSDHLSSSSRRRSPSPTIHYHRSQGLLDRAGSIFNSRPSSSSGTRSRAGSTSMRSTYDSDRGTQQGTQFRYHSRAPTSSSSSGDYGSTYSCHRGTGRRGSSAAPSSSAYGSPYASGQSAPKASSNFHSSSGYSHSYQSGRSTPKTTSQSRSSSASTSRHDSENYSRSSRATNSSHYFVPGDKSSSPSRSHSTSRDSRSKDSHSTSSRSHSTAKETRSKDSHATSSRSHSRTDSHSSSSRSTARPTSRTDSCSTSGTSRHHSSRDTFKTDARSTTASSRFASNLKTTTNGPQHTQSQLAAIFKSYDAKWSNLGRTDKKYPIPASTSDLFKLDFSGAWQARNRNWSNEAVFVANVQLVYLAGFGIAATLNDRGDTLSVDYNRDGTSSKLQSLAKWLGRVEIPRFHPDRMNLRTGVEGKVDQSISKKMEVVAMRTAAQTLLELVN